ncbi:MAG: hypothetical protein K2Y21_12955 [Phycisphaerales bacterium]|nr:hypothetical protein [Phycisphaerales bacterium]
MSIELGRCGRSAAVAGVLGMVAAWQPAWGILPKRVYIAPDDHTDYFWTADDAQYRQAYQDMLDFYLDQIDATAGDPSDRQARWACDGSLWLWEYERAKSGPEWQRLLARIKDGHVSAPMTALVSCYGGQPAEAVLRGMYYAGRLERREGLRFELAVAMENQTLPLGLASLWAGSGAKYSWRGVCACASDVPNSTDRLHDIYRAVGPDGSGVLMKWNSQLNGNQSLGGYAEARFPGEAVDFVTVNAPFNGFAARYPYDVIGAFGAGWDDFQTFTTEFPSVAAQKSDATRRVIVSNEEDFFRDFDATYGAGSTPAVSVSYGNEWELDAVSLAEANARARRSVERLRGAESLATLVSLYDPAFLSGRQSERDRAFMNLGLFWEHNFGMVSPPSGSSGIAKRIQWQKDTAAQIESYVSTLESDALVELGGLVRTEAGANRFLVFNPLSWSRTDRADVAYSGPANVHVREVERGIDVPSQIVSINGATYLRILASDVPSVGYRVYEIVPGPGTAFSAAATVSGTGSTRVIENAVYRATVTSRGAVTSLLDKRVGSAEFAATIGGRAINDLGSGTGTFAVENAGPVSATIVTTAAGPLAHTTRVTLTRDSERIEFANTITQNFTSTETWGFGFSVPAPVTRHEEVGAILRAAIEPVGDYSNRNARYDWLTLNHFVELAGAGKGVCLSNIDCSFFRLGQSSTTFLDAGSAQVNVLAGGRIVNGSNGLPGQGGDSLFLQRFALRTQGASDTVSAMRFALEHQNPLLAASVTGVRASLPGTAFSLASVSNPNVILWALKPAEEGIEPAGTGVDGPDRGGIVARLWNVSEGAQSATLQIGPRKIRTAHLVTHIETNRAGGAQAVDADGVDVALLRQQIVSLRLARTCLGDLTADGFVDDADFVAFAAAYNQLLTQDGDFDGDGQTDDADFVLFASAYNELLCP